MFIPCKEHCYLRYGKQYTKECDDNCDYAHVAKLYEETKQILKSVLTYYDGCAYCKHYPICAVGHCNNYEKYELDWVKIKNNYPIDNLKV